jgi:hypothetical protein
MFILLRVGVLEHRDGPVRLLRRRAHEDHAASDERVIVPRKVVRLDEDENAPAV